jgi:hypothetical protein
MAALLRVARDIHAGTVALVRITDLGTEPLEAWGKIGAATMVPVYRAFGPRPPGKGKRIVKHTLADGTEKIYRYERFVRKVWPVS